MKLVTQRDQIRTLPERYLAAHRGAPTDQAFGQRRRALAALDLETVDPGDVDAIMGNKLWTRLICSHCAEPCTVLINLGASDQVDARYCADCLARGAELIATVVPKGELQT